MDGEADRLTLDNVMVAAPCDVAWDDMVGDDTVRNCLSCKLNVYNLANYNRKDAEAILNSDLAESGKVCVQLYRRKDGTILTSDCPRGLARIRNFSTRAWRTVAAVVAALLTGSPMLAGEKTGDKAPKGKEASPECAEDRPMAIRGKVQVVPPVKGPQPQTQQKSPDVVKTEDPNAGKAHYTAFQLFSQGQHHEKEKNYAKAVESYQSALTVMSKEKHDPKFQLKVETALSQAKAKAGINQ